MTVGALPITMAPAAGGKSVATEFGWATPFSCATKTPRGGVATSGFNLSTFVGKANSGITSPFTSWQISWVRTGAAAVGTLLFSNNGAISHSGSSSGLGSTTGSSWFSPLTAGIGSSYWIKITPISGSFTTNGAVAWTSLSAGVTCSRSIATIGLAYVGFRVQIATDSAGTNIVLDNSSFSIDVERM